MNDDDRVLMEHHGLVYGARPRANQWAVVIGNVAYAVRRLKRDAEDVASRMGGTVVMCTPELADIIRYDGRSPFIAGPDGAALAAEMPE
jgi:hypothetical protein